MPTPRAQTPPMGVLQQTKAWRRERPANQTKRSSDLTPEEQENVRKALRFLAVRLAGWRELAKAMGAGEPTVWKSAHRGRVSAGLALRASRVAKVPLEDMLSAAWPPEGVCPHCGARGPS
jgi:hypothetical protein